MFFVGGDLADFMSGAMPGIFLGVYLLDLLIAPRETKEKKEMLTKLPHQSTNQLKKNSF